MNRYSLLHFCAGALVAVAVTAGSSAGVLSALGLSSELPDYDKKIAKPWLTQIEEKKGFPEKPYAPRASTLAPYAKASVGPEIAWSMAQGFNFAAAPQAQAYCQTIVDKLLAAWNGPKPVVKAVITGEPFYGAKANATGDIFIAIGTFNADPSKGVQNEEELALLLGHELSHLLLLHQSNKQTLGDLTGLLSSAASIYTTATMFRSAGKGQRNAQQQAADQQALLQSVVGGLATTMLVGDVFAPSYGRSDEAEADKMGLDLARAAGYSVGPDEIGAFLQKQSDDQVLRSARVERLKNASMVLYLKANEKDGKTSLGNVGIALGGAMLFDGIMNGVATGKSHPDLAPRLKELNDYATASYGAVAPKAPGGRLKAKQVKGLAVVLKLPLIRSMVASANAGERVSEMLTTYSVASANAQPAATAKTAATPPLELPSPCAGPVVKLTPKPGEVVTINVAFPMDNAPVTWRIRGDWQNVTQACRGRASQDYGRSISSGLARPSELHKVVEVYSGTNDRAKLPGIYARYLAIYGTDQDFLDLAVSSALARGDLVTAETKAADCYVHDGHRLYPVCAQLLGYDPLDKKTPAKTEQGKKAFQEKGLSGSLSDLLGGSASSLFGDK